MIRYSRELRRHHDERRAIVETLRAQGPPILYVSIALAAGFAVLGLSAFVPTRQLGLLCGFVMLAALGGELFVAPLVMSSTRLVTL